MNNLEMALGVKRLLKEKGVYTVDIDEVLTYIEQHPEIKDCANSIKEMHNEFIQRIIDKKDNEIADLMLLLEEV